MRMDRKWIALALAAALTATIGCNKKDPVVEPPAVDTTPTEPVNDVRPEPTTAPDNDIREEKPPEDIEQLQERLFNSGLIGDVFFDFDQYELTDEAKSRLAKNAEFMKSAEGRTLTFKIEGHCDERGTNEYNLALGENRSNAARDYLAQMGISTSMLSIISYGEERPFCTESSDGCWAKNRRARFVITARN